MRVNITTNIVVTLVLSPDEANWLNGVMQNPLHGQDPGTEPLDDKEMRRKFFDATQIDPKVLAC